MNPPDAALYLRAARKFRALGDVQEAMEYAHAARHLAIERGDGVTVYRSLACVGHLRYYRAEYSDAYQWYWQALTEARAWDVIQWIPAAHHDCWLSGVEAGLAREQTDPHGAAMAGGWEPFPRGAWRFVFDHASLRDDAYPQREHARFLASAALDANWHTLAPRGADEYAQYQGLFERMVTYAGMVQGFGGAGMMEQWRRSQNLFDMAAEALGTYEGYALCCIACANGAWRVGERLTACSLINRAISVADSRGETAVIAQANALRDGWPAST